MLADEQHATGEITTEPYLRLGESGVTGERYISIPNQDYWLSIDKNNSVGVIHEYGVDGQVHIMLPKSPKLIDIPSWGPRVLPTSTIFSKYLSCDARYVLTDQLPEDIGEVIPMDQAQIWEGVRSGAITDANLITALTQNRLRRGDVYSDPHAVYMTLSRSAAIAARHYAEGSLNQAQYQAAIGNIGRANQLDDQSFRFRQMATINSSASYDRDLPGHTADRYLTARQIEINGEKKTYYDGGDEVVAIPVVGKLNGLNTVLCLNMEYAPGLHKIAVLPTGGSVESFDYLNMEDPVEQDSKRHKLFGNSKGTIDRSFERRILHLREQYGNVVASAVMEVGQETDLNVCGEIEPTFLTRIHSDLRNMTNGTNIVLIEGLKKHTGPLNDTGDEPVHVRNLQLSLKELTTAIGFGFITDTRVISMVGILLDLIDQRTEV